MRRILPALIADLSLQARNEPTAQGLYSFVKDAFFPPALCLMQLVHEKIHRQFLVFQKRNLFFSQVGEEVCNQYQSFPGFLDNCMVFLAKLSCLTLGHSAEDIPDTAERDQHSQGPLAGMAPIRCCSEASAGSDPCIFQRWCMGEIQKHCKYYSVWHTVRMNGYVYSRTVLLTSSTGDGAIFDCTGWEHCSMS